LDIGSSAFRPWITRIRGKSEQQGGQYAQSSNADCHRNENKRDAPARTIELLIIDKGKPQSNPVATD
jgi:hypothetical protein